jgi:hypothetical protein
MHVCNPPPMQHSNAQKHQEHAFNQMVSAGVWRVPHGTASLCIPCSRLVIQPHREQCTVITVLLRLCQLLSGVRLA